VIRACGDRVDALRETQYRHGLGAASCATRSADTMFKTTSALPSMRPPSSARGAGGETQPFLVSVLRYAPQVVPPIVSTGEHWSGEFPDTEPVQTGSVAPEIGSL